MIDSASEPAIDSAADGDGGTARAGTLAAPVGAGLTLLATASAAQAATPPATPLPAGGIPGPVALLLLLVSIAVLTVTLDRLRWWVRWWQRRPARLRRWQAQVESGEASSQFQLEDWERAMASGEALLRSAAVLAPLLGLIGTGLGLMDVLAQLGHDLTLPAGASLQGYGQVLLSSVMGLIISLVATVTLQANQALSSWQIGQLQRRLRRDAPLPQNP